jgi:hypothetical protein
MSHNLSATIEISSRQVQRTCTHLGIPGLRPTPDGLAAAAPIKLVRAVVDHASELVMSLAEGRTTINYEDYEVLDTARALGAHAEAYIMSATRTADTLKLTGRDRRRFLQRATRHYRAYFA